MIFTFSTLRWSRLAWSSDLVDRAGTQMWAGDSKAGSVPKNVEPF